jgi:manganese/zinc/iron transport system permease protein
MPGLSSNDLWIMLTGAVCAVSCSLLGCFLVLRRMAMLGDAISHAVLPGLALAFMITHNREMPAMLVGAMAVGVLTAFLSTGLAKWGRVPEDAAMGVVFTSLFALGVILITWVARDVDLDPGCVLYGLIEFVPLDMVNGLGIAMPRALVPLLALLVVNVSAVTIFHKELKIVSFDPYLATTMGISAVLVHYALMTLVAATTVVSFEAVGSVLVVAMLIAPGATAHLLTDRLSRMLWIAAIVALIAAIGGYLFAKLWNTSVAGMISVVAGGEFFLAALFAPRHGFVAKQAMRMALTFRISREDVLGMLFRWHEQESRATARAGTLPALTAADVARGLAQGWLARLAVWSLSRGGLVAESGGLRLTPKGLERAAQIVRSHRLWEGFLAKHLALPLDHLHEPSERMEHFITPGIREELAADVGSKVDPHGREIPQ